MKNLFAFFMVFIASTMLISPAWGKADVMRDQYGIPSIQADTEEELFEAFGYAVAVDRLWQMEVNKRLAWGTFAEIFGPKLVPMDSMTRMNRYTEEEYREIFKKIPGGYQKLISAYIRGINRRVDELLAYPARIPMEYLALKIKPRHFREIDSLSFLSALYRIFGIRGGGELKNLSALQTLVKRFGRGEGWAVFNDLYWIDDPAAPTYTDQNIQGDHIPGRIKTAGLPFYLEKTDNVARLVMEDENRYVTAIDEAGRVGAPVKPGSYSWTLSPKVTGTGYPILVGQVQAQHGSVPSIVHEVHLKGGRFDVVGASVPLLPFVLAGHNRHLAWSIMVGMVDGVDIYQEILNPNDKEEYLFRGSWKRMEKRIERIIIAGGQVKEIAVYRTVHGPVFSTFPFDPQSFKGDRVYTKKIAWWQTESIFAEGLFKINLAGDIKEFGEAMALHTPTVHYTYADTSGNIGYWHNGLNPERADGFDPRFPLPGTGEAEWTGRYLPNAHVVNPAKGYVTGWNNKASPDTRNPFHTDPNYQFGSYHRSLWLERALAGRINLDMAASKEIMRHIGGAGVYSSNDPNSVGYTCKELLPFTARAVNGAKEDEMPVLNKVMAVLGTWDGRSVNNPVSDELFQAGQTIYLDWLSRLIKATFGDELEGIEPFKTVHHQTLGLLLRCLRGPVTTLPVSRNYFDDITTSGKETMEDIFLKTLRETVDHLKKTFQSEDPAMWKAPRSKVVYKHNMFGKVAEMWDNNIGTYIIIVELRPEGAVGYSRFHLGESGNISAGPDKKPVFDPHFFDMQPLFQTYTHQKMGLD